MTCLPEVQPPVSIVNSAEPTTQDQSSSQASAEESETEPRPRSEEPINITDLEVKAEQKEVVSFNDNAEEHQDELDDSELPDLERHEIDDEPMPDINSDGEDTVPRNDSDVETVRGINNRGGDGTSSSAGNDEMEAKSNSLGDDEMGARGTDSGNDETQASRTKEKRREITSRNPDSATAGEIKCPDCQKVIFQELLSSVHLSLLL